MKELTLLFLKLGATAFGGPAAHISIMEEEIVKRRKWITHEHFLDLLGATNLIPGPNSTEMAIHIGYVRFGWKGLIIAGICFILPAVLITLLFAHLYVTYGSIPELGFFMVGFHSAIIAVIAAAVFRLGRPIIKKRFMLICAPVVTFLTLFGVNEIFLLFAAGAIGLLLKYIKKISDRTIAVLFAPLAFLMISSITRIPVITGSVSLLGLAVFFLKIGSILYGSGYVLVAFLQGGLVDTRHWLTQSQLLDAIAIGQFTPGPVLSTATFIGYIILGIPGAIVATIGIFLPSFIFVLISNPFIQKLRNSKLASGFLDGVNAASLGLMSAITIILAITSLTSLSAVLVFLVALFMIAVWNINAIWIIIGSGAFGWIFAFLHIH